MTTFLLNACGNQSEQVTQSDLQAIQSEVTALKQQVDELKVKSAEAETAARVPVTPPKPVMSYQLIGSSFKDEGSFQYASRERCETARQALLDNWAGEDERNRERGILFTSRPTPTCLPL